MGCHRRTFPRLRAALAFLDGKMDAGSHHGDRAILTLRATEGGESQKDAPPPANQCMNSARRALLICAFPPQAFFAAGAGEHAAGLPHAACLRWCDEASERSCYWLELEFESESLLATTRCHPALTPSPFLSGAALVPPRHRALHRDVCWAGLGDLLLDAFTVDHLYLAPICGRGTPTTRSPPAHGVTQASVV